MHIIAFSPPLKAILSKVDIRIIRYGTKYFKAIGKHKEFECMTVEMS